MSYIYSSTFAVRSPMATRPSLLGLHLYLATIFTDPPSLHLGHHLYSTHPFQTYFCFSSAIILTRLPSTLCHYHFRPPSLRSYHLYPIAIFTMPSSLFWDAALPCSAAIFIQPTSFKTLIVFYHHLHSVTILRTPTYFGYLICLVTILARSPSLVGRSHWLAAVFGWPPSLLKWETWKDFFT